MENIKPAIDVHIIYLDKPNTEVGFLRLPSVPRVGEFIILEGGAKYKVMSVIYDDRVPNRGTDVCMEIKFDSIATFDS